MTFHGTLEHELADPAALAALVIDGIVELPACQYPRTHAAQAAPFWAAAGELRCAVCAPDANIIVQRLVTREQVAEWEASDPACERERRRGAQVRG